MRQRRLKDLDTLLDLHSDVIHREPCENKGHWREAFEKEGEHLYLELGCGKAQFIIQKANTNPSDNFIAIEGNLSVAVRASEKIKRTVGTVPNMILVGAYVEDIHDMFENGELDGMYLNFSDPWPKDRHAKRRLTHRRFLLAYKDIIKDGGFIEFKTDNDGLFDFTLEEVSELGFEIVEQTRDLHASDYDSRNCMTEYEEKFLKKAKNINYLRIKL